MQCSSITKLFFNFSTSNDSDTVISTAGDTAVEEYIDGGQRRRYAFELSRFCPISFTQNDPGNVDMLEDAYAIAAWVEEQNAVGNLPRLPGKCTADAVVLLDEYSGFVAAQNGTIAKYMLPFALDYTKQKG